MGEAFRRAPKRIDLLFSWGREIIQREDLSQSYHRFVRERRWYVARIFFVVELVDVYHQAK